MTQRLMELKAAEEQITRVSGVLRSLIHEGRADDAYVVTFALTDSAKQVAELVGHPEEYPGGSLGATVAAR